MKAIKVKPLVISIKNEFKKLPNPQSGDLNIIKTTEEQMATARLDSLLSQLEQVDDIANAKSLKGLMEFLTDRDKAVGIDYRHDKSSILNAKCRIVAEKLCAEVFEGKKLWDFLMPTMPKDKGIHVPINHHHFNEKVFVNKLLTERNNTYNFDHLHKDLKNKQELLNILSQYTSPDQWSVLMDHLSLKKLTGLVLGVEGKALDDLMSKKNYAALMLKLEAEMKNKSNYKLDNVIYNRAYQFCIMEVYERHRKHQPDHLSTFGYYWGSPDKSQKLELAQAYKNILASKVADSVILESIAGIKNTAANDGFMLAFKNVMRENLTAPAATTTALKS